MRKLRDELADDRDDEGLRDRKEPDVIGCFDDHGRRVALHLESHPQTGDTLVVARVANAPATPTGATCRWPAARPRAPRWTARSDGCAPAGATPPTSHRPRRRARAGLGRPTTLRLDTTADRGSTRAQAQAVVAYVANAERRGFCFFGNPAAR